MKVVEVQITPNPNARKFVVSERVSETPLSFFNAGSAKGNVLAEALFGVPGVASVLILNDFITVNKVPEPKWPDIVAGVKKVVAASGA